jgi:hypothetical protein
MSTRTNGRCLERISGRAALCLALLIALPLTNCNQAPPAAKTAPTASAISVTTEPGGPVNIRN